MKRVAVLIYDQFCNFEFSVLLEMFAMEEKQITVFAKELKPVRSEEGLRMIPDKTIYELDLNEYDCLVLPGAADIREAVEDPEIIDFIGKFVQADRFIGAISIAPLLLLKQGALKGRRFLIGANKEDLYEEGFTDEDMKNMVDWNTNLANPVKEGYIKVGKIITSVSYGFIPWAVAFGEELGIHISARCFEWPKENK